jgi:hypothetical protein
MKFTGQLKFSAIVLTALTTILLGSCASMAKYQEPFTELDSVPEGKAVVYMYHDKDFDTPIGGQNASFFPRSVDPNKKFNSLFNRAMPGTVGCYSGEAARFIVDPSDNVFVIHTFFSSYYGGGFQSELELQIPDLKAGDTAYIDVSLNGFTQNIKADIKPEANVLPLIQKKGKLNKAF